MKLFLRVGAVTLIAVVLGVNLAETMRPLLPLWPRAADFVVPSEKRFERLRQQLPPAGEVGYISGESPGDVLVAPEAVRRYYLTQYALAPLVVAPDKNHPVVVGVFDKGPVELTISPGFSIEDAGSGVVLMKQAPR